jgi:hypothetical protein
VRKEKVNEDILIGKTMKVVSFLDNLFTIALACGTKDEPEDAERILNEGRAYIVREILSANAGRALAFESPELSKKYHKFFDLLAKEAARIKI